MQAVRVPEGDDVRPVGEPGGVVVAERGCTVDRSDLELRKERQERLAGGGVAADDEDPLDPGLLGGREELVRRFLVGIAG